MRTLLLICLLLALIVVAVREPGEGYPEAALRLVSEASDAATRMVGKDIGPDQVALPTLEAITKRQLPSAGPATSMIERRPPVIERTPPLEWQAGVPPSPPPMESAPATPRLAPATPSDGVAPGNEGSDALPEFLPPGPEGDRAGQEVGRVSSRALYREATRLLREINR